VAVQRLTRKRLVKMLAFMSRPEVVATATALGERIAAEPDGAAQAVHHFHRHIKAWRAAQPAWRRRPVAERPPADGQQAVGPTSAAQPAQPAQPAQQPAPQPQPEPQPAGSFAQAPHQPLAHGDGGAAPIGARPEADTDSSEDEAPSRSCCSGGSRRVWDSAAGSDPPGSGATATAERSESTLLDDLEKGWSSSRSIQVCC